MDTAMALHSLACILGDAQIDVGLVPGKAPHVHGHLTRARQELDLAAVLMDVRVKAVTEGT